MTLAAAMLTTETTLFVLAGAIGFLAMGYTLAEAGAAAVMVLFMAISLIHQIDFLIGSPWPGYFVETAMLLAALGSVVCCHRAFLRILKMAMGFFRQEPLPCVLLAATWVAMAGLVAAGGPGAPPDSGSYTATLLQHGGILTVAARQALTPLNIPALFYHTSRFGLGSAACGFGILAHMAVGLSTYALSRRHAFAPMALTVTLMVLSMPRLVFLGRYPSAEMIDIACIAFCMLMLYRLLEQAQARDLHLFLLCICFSVQKSPMSLALVSVMLILLALLMARRYGWLLWREMIGARPMASLLLLPALMLFAQLPAFGLNGLHGQPLLGMPVVFDTDGIFGAAANLARYLFVSVDPTEPVRRALVWLVGLDLRRLLMGIYGLLVTPFAGQAGAAVPFDVIFSGSGAMGFGPVAPLLVLPAMGHAFFRGPRRLKAVSVAWAGYLYLAALVVAWQPASLAVLSPLYATNGFMVAFSLPPWRLRRRGMRLLQVVFAFLLAWSLACGGGISV